MAELAPVQENPGAKTPPRWVVLGKDGKQYTVFAPNAQSALRSVNARIDKRRAPLPVKDQAADVAKSAGMGLVSGGERLAGTLGEAMHILRELGTTAGRKIRTGLMHPPDTGKLAPDPLGLDRLPDTKDIKEYTPWDDYKPKTPLGQDVYDTAELVPGAVVGGGGMLGGLARRELGSAALGATEDTLRYAVIPKQAGNLAAHAPDVEGSNLEPAAELGGMAAAAIMGPRRLISPFPSKPGREAARSLLRSEGVRTLTAGQRTGHRGLQRMERNLSGGKFEDLSEQQLEEFTEAVLRKAGIKGQRRLDQDVLEAQGKRLGRKFEDFGRIHDLTLDSDAIKEIQAAHREYYRSTGSATQAQIVDDIVNDILNAPHPYPGREYIRQRSKLGELARSGTDSEKKMAFTKLQHALDSAMDRSLPNQDLRDALRDLRKKYANLLVLDNVAATGGAAEGLVTPSALRQAEVTLRKKRHYGRGRSEFSRLAKAGEMLMTKPPALPGSALSVQAGPVAGGVVAGATTGDPVFGAKVAATLAAPAAIGRAALSKPGRALLGNQMWRRRPHEKDLPRKSLTKAAIIGTGYADDVFDYEEEKPY